MGNCHFLQERKNDKSPGVCPGGGAWLQVKLNHDDYKTSKNDLCFSGWMDG